MESLGAPGLAVSHFMIECNGRIQEYTRVSIDLSGSNSPELLALIPPSEVSQCFGTSCRTCWVPESESFPRSWVRIPIPKMRTISLRAAADFYTPKKKISTVPGSTDKLTYKFQPKLSDFSRGHA